MQRNYPKSKLYLRGYGRKPEGESNLEFRTRVEEFGKKFFE